jgi:Fic family protein
MTLHSQLPAPVRNALIGVERVRPVVAVVPMTKHADVYLEYQVAMLKEAERLNKRRKTADDHAASVAAMTAASRKAAKERSEAARQRVLSVLDTPNTIKGVAALLGISENSVKTQVRELAKEGRIQKAGFGPKPLKGGAAGLWVRA